MDCNPEPSLMDDRPRLLIADDEEIICQRLMALGQKIGFEVRGAASGTEAIAIYNEFQPDLAVLDIYMPGMNGIGVLTHIKNLDPECLVILITGFLHYEQLIRTSIIKPDGCIIKPLDLEKTAALMMKLVQQRPVCA
jgi:YesN/AraC family two-component response regulator